MSALIGALRVSLSADTAKFEEGMKRAQRQARTSSTAINKSMGALKAGVVAFASALSVGLLTRVIKSALDYAGGLGEVAQQLGVTTRDLQIFRFAAGQAGVSQEEMDKGLGKLTISLGQVAAGAKAPIAALKAIGITADELRGKNTGEAFRMIADGLQKVTDRSQRAAVEVALFGRAGAKLDTLLSGGSEALNNLAAAAEKLGVVLSDEQIRNADVTADKLEAMKTVLSANIAGAVANNAEAILSLANAFMEVVAAAGRAIQALGRFEAYAQGIRATVQAQRQRMPAVVDAITNTLGIINPVLGAVAKQYAGGGKKLGSSATVKLAPASDRPIPAGPDISQFLAGGGGKAKKAGKGPRAPRDTSLRDAHQFDMDLRRAQMDVLRATQDLSTSYVERNTIAVQILDAERSAYKAELDYEVAAKEKTAAQAGQLLALYDTRDALERQKILADEQAQAAEDASRFQALVLDLDRDLLESKAQLAETADEQRKAQLEILDHVYRQRKAALDAAIATEKDAATIQRLTLQRDRLVETYANDRQAVMRGTRGPLEEWAASIPQTAAQINEAFQSIQADGLEGLSDAIADVLTGTRSLSEAFGDMARSIISDIIRMTIRMLIFRAISGMLGGLGGGLSGGAINVTNTGANFAGTIPKFAGGGSFKVLGKSGTDRNIMAINGVPVARVSHNERVDVSNDNQGGGIPARVILEIDDPLLRAKIVSGAVEVVGQAAPSIMDGATRQTARLMQRPRLG